MYSHLRWTWGCANVLIRRGVNVTGIGQLIILLSPPVLDVSNKRIHLTWPVSTCQDNQKWVLETAAASSEERIWGVEDVINLLSPAANTKWIPYKQQMSILCMYCTNDFLNVSENPFNTHYVPSQLWIGQELLSFVLYYCITIVPFDFWVNEVKWKEIKLFFIQISWVDTWYVVFLKCVSTLHLMYFLIMYFDTTVLYFKENGFPL